MSRATQFIDYINQTYEPDKRDKKMLYTSIAFNKKRKTKRKEYRKVIKNNEI